VGDDLIRLLLVDDHATLRELMAERLGLQPGLAVAGAAGSLAEARALLAAGVAVDVALVDLDLPDGHGAELVHDLRRRDPGALALVLTGSCDQRDHARAVAAGAAAILPKTTPIREVVGAVRRLHAGAAFLSREEVAELVRQAEVWEERGAAERAALGRLTAREREVLRLLAEGLGDKEIADRLYLSDRTVRNHMTHLLAKLGVDSRLQALVLAARHGAVRVG
jgi:DNA-binding NarL/FixJ family response regulator